MCLDDEIHINNLARDVVADELQAPEAAGHVSYLRCSNRDALDVTLSFFHLDSTKGAGRLELDNTARRPFERKWEGKRWKSRRFQAFFSVK